jgi:SAM-dependent methyltransferase
MNSISCPSCELETVQFTRVLYPSFNEKAGCIPSHILECPQCGLEFAHPMPSEGELQALYQSNEYWGDTAKPLISPITFPVPFALAETRWSLLVSYLPKWDKEVVINVLDIGAGQGCFGMVASEYLPEHKIDYTAVEPDLLMRDSLNESWKNVDSKVQLRLYNSLDGIKQKFNIIVLSHVLEHISDPVNFLESLHELLDRDGLLFVDVPNQDHLFKKNVFPHLLFFSPESLKSVLENSGFMTITVGSWGRGRESTPMNGNVFSLLRILEKVIFKFRKIIPARGLMTYFAWHFGIGKTHPQGTWVRAIAELKQGS